MTNKLIDRSIDFEIAGVVAQVRILSVRDEMRLNALFQQEVEARKQRTIDSSLLEQCMQIAACNADELLETLNKVECYKVIGHAFSQCVLTDDERKKLQSSRGESTESFVEDANLEHAS